MKRPQEKWNHKKIPATKAYDKEGR